MTELKVTVLPCTMGRLPMTHINAHEVVALTLTVDSLGVGHVSVRMLTQCEEVNMLRGGVMNC